MKLLISSHPETEEYCGLCFSYQTKLVEIAARQFTQPSLPGISYLAFLLRKLPHVHCGYELCCVIVEQLFPQRLGHYAVYKLNH